MRHRPLLLGVSVLALAAQAHAQQAEDVITLQPIVVQATDDPTDPADGFVATTQASATKTGTPRLETQQTVSVVTAEQIEAQGADTLGQALNYSAGAFGEPFGQDSRGDGPRLRGFDGSNSQFLNGLKLLRTFTTPAYEIYGLERVEVLHGPSGVLYGAGNPGGMINLIQKRALFDDFNEAGLTFGTNQRVGTFFDMNRTINPDVAYRFTGVLRHQNGNPDEVNDDRIYLAPSLTWRLSEQDTLTFLGSYQWDNPEEPTATTTDALNGDDPLGRDFYLGDEDFNHSDRRQINIGAEWEHRFNDDWSLTQSFRVQSFEWESEWLSFSNIDGDTANRYATLQDEDTTTINLDTRVTGTVDTGAASHKLLFGLDIRRFDQDVVQGFDFTGSAPGLSISDPDHSMAFVPDYNFLYSTDSQLTQTGLYAQDELSFGNWRATLGLRHDLVVQEGTLNAMDVKESDSATSGRAGLSYVFANGVAPFVSYAESFDPVILTPTALTTFEPSRGKQWEAGVKYEPAAYRGFFSATVFDLEQTNVSYAIDRTTTGQRDQKSRGLELEGTAELTDNLTLRAAYSFIDAEIVGGGSDGLTPENTPENVASLWADYAFTSGRLDGLTLGGGVRYIDERLGYNLNDLAAPTVFELDSQTLLDASVGYERGAFDARLTIQNLTDEDYFGTCNQFGCRYAAGRTVVADVAYKW